MMLVQTYVAPSHIEGVGIFAAENIKSGQAIWRFDPLFDRTLTCEELAQLELAQREYVERYSYTHMQDPSLVVIESDNGRFMNHSEHPNTDFTRSDIAFAIMDIPEGSEITCDYGEFEPTYRMQPGRKFTDGAPSNQQIYAQLP